MSAESTETIVVVRQPGKPDQRISFPSRENALEFIRRLKQLEQRLEAGVV